MMESGSGPGLALDDGGGRPIMSCRERALCGWARDRTHQAFGDAVCDRLHEALMRLQLRVGRLRRNVAPGPDIRAINGIQGSFGHWMIMTCIQYSGSTVPLPWALSIWPFYDAYCILCILH